MQANKPDNVGQRYVRTDDCAITERTCDDNSLQRDGSGRSVSAQVPYLFNDSTIHEVALIEKLS